jgi:hypothetical protein
MNTTTLYSILSDVFGPAAWSALPTDQRHLVARDVELMVDEPSDAEERTCDGDYRAAATLLRRRVGAGNLSSYGATLAAGAARKGPACGCSACRQNWIETGETRCVANDGDIIANKEGN